MKKIELQLLTTLQCNLKCSYCSEEVGGTRSPVPTPIEYTYEQLDAFVNKFLDGVGVYVTFYGGEPTMNHKFMADIIELYPFWGYQLQTNGTLLHKMAPTLIEYMDNILVSVDGNRHVTDKYRGEGVFDQVMANVEHIRPHISGLLTARVTLSDPDITAQDITDLLHSFDYVYFQFVAGEAYSPEYVIKMKLLLDELVAKYFDTKALLRIVPIMSTVRNKLRPDLAPFDTQCRTSTHLLNVMPNGDIYPCPDMLYRKELRMGSIQENELYHSKLQQDPDMPCWKCSAFEWCKSNCLKNLHIGYVDKDSEYAAKVTDPICDLIRYMGLLIDARIKDYKVPIEVLNSPIYQYVEVMP